MEDTEQNVLTNSLGTEDSNEPPEEKPRIEVQSNGSERCFLRLSNFECELTSSFLQVDQLCNLVLQMKEACANGNSKERNYTG